MTVSDAVAVSSEALGRAGVDTPRLDAQLLIAWALRVRREDLAREPDRVLSAREEAIVAKAVALRAERRPLPYITGEAHFYGRAFKVNRAVLIPRPETELLVDFALAEASQRLGAPFRAADIGSGSGCIAVSIACEAPHAAVVATDISALALNIAAKNLRRHGIADRVSLRQGSLCEPLGPNERFDVIVSNPPYICLADGESLMPEVRLYEPPLALYGAEIGASPALGPAALRRALAAQARAHLRSGGRLAIEIGAGQAPEAKCDFFDLGYESVATVRDGAGIERIVTATAP